MRKLLRKIKFYFLWKMAMKIASDAVNKDPMMFPHFMTLSFSEDRALEYYLANYTVKEAIHEILAEQQTAFKRREYKQKKREEMLMAMSPEEYEIYIDRVIDWEDFADARKQFATAK